MTYADDKMLSFAALMTDMSEDLIQESDIRGCAATQPKRERTSRFSTLMNHPAMVAVLCAVVSLGVVVAIVLAGRGGPVTPPMAETPHVEETETQEPSDSELIPADFESYESIIRMYRKIVETIPDIYTAPGWDYSLVFDRLFSFPDDQTKETYTRMCDAILTFYPGERVNLYAFFGYVIKDVNGDGVEELFFLTEDFTVITLFTQLNGKPVLLEDFWNRKKGYVNENGQIMIGGSSGADVSSQEIYHIDAATGQLVFEEAIGLDGHTEDLQTIYYHRIGEERTHISEDEFNAIKNQEPYVGFGTEKNRQVLEADYTPVSMPSEVSVSFFVGSDGLEAKYIRIYTAPEKIYAYADFFTDVLVRSDPPEVPEQHLGGGTYWITMAYENGTAVTFADWGAYIEYENKWYQLEGEYGRVIDTLFELYESDVEIMENHMRVLTVDETGIYGVVEDTGKSIYVKGFDGTRFFKKSDIVNIVYTAEMIRESEGAVVSDSGETVTYQWILEDPLSVWVSYAS